MLDKVTTFLMGIPPWHVGTDWTVKTRLEIILNAFVEKKEIFFDYNDKNVSKTFSKGLIHTFAKKMQFSC